MEYYLHPLTFQYPFLEDPILSIKFFCFKDFKYPATVFRDTFNKSDSSVTV